MRERKRGELTTLSTITADQLTADNRVVSLVVQRSGQQFAELELSEKVGAKEERQTLLTNPVEHFVLFRVVEVETGLIVCLVRCFVLD